MTDWRDAVLVGVEPLLPEAETAPHAMWTGHGRIGRADVVVAAFDFSIRGGSVGEWETGAFAAACAEAAATRRPLVSMIRSGGTRLQEGMRALVGIPRAMLALDLLADAGVPHVSVIDDPTTGGAWVGIGSVADVRIGVAGATVGFSGPRVVEAMTGVALPRGTSSAESAAAAGLVDVVLPPERIATWLENVLVVLRPDDPMPTPPPVPVGVPDRSGWEQVQLSRTRERPAGADLVAALLDDGDEEAVPVCGSDDSVVVRLGRLGGHRVVLMAMSSRRAGRIEPGGYALATRGARLAGRLDLACVTLIDTAGADPLPVSEQSGIAPAIATAMRAVLDSPGPTISVVHGEGGSGGALAGAVTDVVAVTETGWFAALGPEGAAAALRTTPEEAADLMGVTPRDLLASGFADVLAPSDVASLRQWLAARLDELRAVPPAERMARRRGRWAGPLPGSSPSGPPDDPDIA